MVSRDEVLRIARLAKLALRPEEEARIGEQLGRILEYVEQLRELDEETAGGATGLPVTVGPARPDVAIPGLGRDDALGLAPAHDGETYLVPAVIDPGTSS